MTTGESTLGKQYTRLQLTLDDGTAVMRATAWSRDASSLNTLLEKDTYYDMYNLKFQRKQGFPCQLGMTSATMAIRCEDQQKQLQVHVCICAHTLSLFIFLMMSLLIFLMMAKMLQQQTIHMHCN